MTLLLPFLPIYVEQLGVKDHAAIVQWSGIAYGATFFTAALTAPLWGQLGDRYGLLRRALDPNGSIAQLEVTWIDLQLL